MADSQTSTQGKTVGFVQTAVVKIYLNILGNNRKIPKAKWGPVAMMCVRQGGSGWVKS